MAGRKRFDVTEALDGAMRAFWQHGYAEASMSRLISATGLGRGSLYATFGDKRALFLRSLDRYSEVFGEQLGEALRSQDEPVAAVRAFYERTLARLADPAVPAGCLVAQTAAENPELDDALRESAAAAIAKQRANVRAALEPASATVAATGLDELALYVTAVNQSLSVLHRAGIGVDELRGIARTATETVAATVR